MKRMYDENEIRQIASEAGGGKLYLHSVKVKSSGIYGVPALDFKVISTSNTKITKDNINKAKGAFDMILSGDDATMPPNLYIARSFLASPDSVSVSYFKTYPTKSDSTSSIEIGSGGNYSIADVITEL